MAKSKKAVVVSKERFDSTLGHLLKKGPVPRESVQVSKKKPATIIEPHQSA